MGSNPVGPKCRISKLNLKLDYVGWLGLISEPDILARDIAAWIFHCRNIWAWGLFGSVDIPAHGHSVSVDVSSWRLSAQGLSAWDISAQK